MRRMVNILLACALCVCVYGSVHAQPADSIAAPTGRRTMPADAGDGAFPLFGIFRNNYFSTGFSTAAPVSQYTADVKFQLSVALRIWRMTDTSEMLFTYTQRSFWDIYRESGPFRENESNPGLWFSWRPVQGIRLMFGLEHESNGFDGDRSRSWNYVSVGCVWAAHERWRVGVRAWYGYYDRKNCPSWFRYRGYGMFWVTYHTLNERLSATVLVNPSNWFRNYNLQGEVSWRLSRRSSYSPALFIRCDAGYAETMLSYNRYSSMVRIGISLTNGGFGFY